MSAPGGLSLQQAAIPDLLGQRQFRAMNTNVQLYQRDVDDLSLLQQAEEVFHSLEARLSRFLPDSELCRLNDCSGHETGLITFGILERDRVPPHHRRVFDPAVL
jgi:hypothetical protein